MKWFSALFQTPSEKQSSPPLGPGMFEVDGKAMSAHDLARIIQPIDPLVAQAGVLA
jgi:hypothetical protein